MDLVFDVFWDSGALTVLAVELVEEEDVVVVLVPGTLVTVLELLVGSDAGGLSAFGVFASSCVVAATPPGAGGGACSTWGLSRFLQLRSV